MHGSNEGRERQVGHTALPKLMCFFTPTGIRVFPNKQQTSPLATVAATTEAAPHPLFSCFSSTGFLLIETQQNRSVRL